MRKFQEYFNALEKLNNENIDNYIKLIDKINSKDKIELVVIGELSNGKSTLINTLINRDILPTGVGATTSKIISIQKGSNKIISDKKELLLSNNDDKNAELIEELITSNKDGKIYIYLNDFIFENTILIDTPGVNDTNEERKLLTYEYAPYSDIVIFIADISKGFTKFEKEFFDNIHESIKEKTFILFNKIDSIKNYKVNAPKNYLKSIGFENFRAYGISASLALDGILDNNSEALKKSQIQEFLNDLKEYIKNNSKNEILKARVVKILNKINDLANEQISNYIKYYNKDIDSVNLELKNVEKNLTQLNREFNIKKRELNTRVGEITAIIYKIFSDLKSKLKAKLNALYNIDRKIEFLQNRFKFLVDEALEEISKNTKGIFQKIYIANIEFKNSDILLYKIETKLNTLSKTNERLTPIINRYFKLKKLDNIDDNIKNYVYKTLNKIEGELDLTIDKIESDINWQLKEKLEIIEAKKLGINKLLQEKQKSKNITDKSKSLKKEELKELNLLFSKLY